MSPTRFAMVKSCNLMSSLMLLNFLVPNFLLLYLFISGHTRSAESRVSESREYSFKEGEITRTTQPDALLLLREEIKACVTSQPRNATRYPKLSDMEEKWFLTSTLGKAEREWLKKWDAIPITNRTTIVPNPDELYSPHLHDRYLKTAGHTTPPRTKYTRSLPPLNATDKLLFKGSTLDESDERWYRAFTMDDVGLRYKSIMEANFPPERSTQSTWFESQVSEKFRLLKRSVEKSDVNESDLSFHIQHSFSSEAMEEKLKTSTLSESEEKLYDYYATKAWSISSLVNRTSMLSTDKRLREPFETSTKRDHETGITKQKIVKSILPETTRTSYSWNAKISSHPANYTGTLSIEENKWNRRFPLSESEEKRQREFKSVVWEGRYSCSSKKNRSHSNKPTLSYKTSQYTESTYAEPTRPPSLSESQESWYAGYEERLKTTLSLEQFQPGNPTWWRGWPSRNFTYTTYPPYNPRNATTTKFPKNGSYLPMYRFPTFQEWQNYTFYRERHANTSRDESLSSLEEYSNEYYMDSGPQRGGTRFSFPDVHLTPTEENEKLPTKETRPFWRGRGRGPKSRKFVNPPGFRMTPKRGKGVTVKTTKKRKPRTTGKTG